MSGVISVTVRLPDGATTKMLWPTSRLHHLQVPGLPEKDDATLKSLTVVGRGPWRGARPWPSRPGTLQPREYGLVVVDLAENRIITRQHATDLRSISMGLILSSARNPVRAAAQRKARGDSADDSLILRFFTESTDPEPLAGEVEIGLARGPWFANVASDAAHAAALYACGRLTHLVLSSLGTAVTINPGFDFGTLLTELTAVSDQLVGHPDPWASILARLWIDWSPIELIDLADADDGGERFYELLREAGMHLTRSEERGWRERGWLSRAGPRSAQAPGSS